MNSFIIYREKYEKQKSLENLQVELSTLQSKYEELRQAKEEVLREVCIMNCYSQRLVSGHTNCIFLTLFLQTVYIHLMFLLLVSLLIFSVCVCVCVLFFVCCKLKHALFNANCVLLIAETMILK